jgi:hypothetical protein
VTGYSIPFASTSICFPILRIGHLAPNKTLVAVGWLAARAENYDHASQGVAVVTSGVDFLAAA